MLKLQHFKAKIIRIHSVKFKSMLTDIHDTTEYQGEKISLYQLIQRRQCRKGRLITELLDETGTLQTSSRAILRVLGEHMRHRYTTIHAERESIEQLRTIEMTRGGRKMGWMARRPDHRSRSLADVGRDEKEQSPRPRRAKYGIFQTELELGKE